jgi:hypothetical protein
MAHVFEMTERADAGVRWMKTHIDRQDADTIVPTYCWWLPAAFHLEQGRNDLTPLVLIPCSTACQA